MACWPLALLNESSIGDWFPIQGTRRRLSSPCLRGHTIEYTANYTATALPTLHDNCRSLSPKKRTWSQREFCNKSNNRANGPWSSRARHRDLYCCLELEWCRPDDLFRNDSSRIRNPRVARICYRALVGKSSGPGDLVKKIQRAEHSRRILFRNGLVERSWNS